MVQHRNTAKLELPEYFEEEAEEVSQSTEWQHIEIVYSKYKDN